VRDGGLVARVGGDEFAVLMFGADEQACSQTVVRLASVIQQHPGLDGFAMSAAIGQATCPPARSVPDAVRVADSVMYSSKIYARRVLRSGTHDRRTARGWQHHPFGVLSGQIRKCVGLSRPPVLGSFWTRRRSTNPPCLADACLADTGPLSCWTGSADGQLTSLHVRRYRETGGRLQAFRLVQTEILHLSRGRQRHRFMRTAATIAFLWETTHVRRWPGGPASNSGTSTD
jgi:hypothetical protein